VTYFSLRQWRPLFSSTYVDPKADLWIILLVRLEGFEPPTLGSVGTFHYQQLGDSLANIVQFPRKMLTRVQGCSSR